jgi:hypothetical protein
MTLIESTIETFATRLAKVGETMDLVIAAKGENTTQLTRRKARASIRTNANGTLRRTALPTWMAWQCPGYAHTHFRVE